MVKLRSLVGGVLVMVAIAAHAARAQTYVTARQVFLRGSPSKTAAKLRELNEGDTVTRRPDVAARPGWLPVRATDGKAGWVGVVHLRSLAVLAASSATTVGSSSGAAAPRIDSTWKKPSIQQLSILVQGGALTCGPRGDDTDDGTNLNKNRADVPDSSHLIAVSAIRSLPDTALWRFTNRRNWTHADSGLVIPYEGIPVTIEGFFEVVKPQNTSPPTAGKKVGESPNCHSWSEDDTDWHIAFVADTSETEDRGVVVEPTPRTKRHHAAWIATEVSKLAIRRSASAPRNPAGATRVRVTGFLMLDPVHPCHIEGGWHPGCPNKQGHYFRATLWEVHPVTRIDVLRNGTWQELTPP